MYQPENGYKLTGVEAVIDKDSASGLLAQEIGADLFVMATDVNGIYLDWGKPSARLIREITPGQLKRHTFPAGSMGPKVEAACAFVEKTGNRASVGALADIQAIVNGDAGTTVGPG
jgi:carbamate kinase